MKKVILVKKDKSTALLPTELAHDTAIGLLPVGYTRNEIAAILINKGVDVTTAITQINKAIRELK